MKLEVGSVLDGKVTGITKFGAFVELPGGTTGMVHISEVAAVFVKEISDYLKEGQEVKVKVLEVTDDGKVNLSIKKAVSPQEAAPKRPQRYGRKPDGEGASQGRFQQKNETMSFEEMITKFKQTSDERMSDLKRNMDGKRGSYSRRGSKSMR